MPYFAPEESIDLVAQGQVATAEATEADKSFAADYAAGLDRPIGQSIGFTLGGSVVDLVDSVASSVGLTDRQDVNNKFLGAVGSPGLTAWANQNRGAMEVGSGILGIVLADRIAGKILDPAGKAMQAIRGVPYAKNIATLDAQVEKARRLANRTQVEAALRGATGIERFIGAEMSIARLGAPALQVSRGQATRAFYRAAATRGLVRNVTTEGIMAATLNTNEFLFSGELAHDLAWMGAGLGLGAMIDSMTTTYALRKFANSEKVKQLNRGAYDPTGFESQRLAAFSTADSILRAAGHDPSTLGFMYQGSGGLTDSLTSQAIQVQELRKQRSQTERGFSLFRKREEMATQEESILFEGLNKVTTRGVRGVAGSAFGTKKETLGAPLKEAIDRNPLALYGMEEIGTVPQGMTREELAKLRADAIDNAYLKVQEELYNGGKVVSRKRKVGGREVFEDTFVPFDEDELKALNRTRDELEFMMKQTPMTMLEPGEWVPLSWGKIADEWTPQLPKMEGGLGFDGKAYWSINRGEDNATRIAVGSDGELFLPGGKKRIEQLEPAEMLDLYVVGRQLVNHFVKTEGRFVLPAKPNWFQLDMAEQILKASGDPNSVQFGEGMTRATALVESFAQKVEILQRRKAARKMAKADEFDLDEMYQFRVMFNLPRMRSAQAGFMHEGDSPLDLLLGGLAKMKPEDIRQNLTPQELLKAFNDAHKIAGFTDEVTDSLSSTQGNSFNFLMDRDGNPIGPIVGFQRPLKPDDFSRDSLFIREAMYSGYVRDTLVGEAADPLNRQLLETLSANPAFHQAMRVMELADDQHRSMIPGFRHAAPQSTMGSLVNSVTSRERRDIDSLTMRAASQIQEEKTRLIQAMTKSIFENGMGDTITKLNQPQNARSLMLMNQFMSFRGGWDLMEKPVETTLPNGEKAWKFLLDPSSQQNKQRFEQAYGKAMEEKQILLGPDGNQIVMDTLAMETLARMQKIHEISLNAKNTLLRSQGLPQISRQSWYVPPPNLNNRYVGYVFDIDNTVIPGMTQVADSPEALQRLMGEVQKSPQWKDGYVVRTDKGVRDFMSLWDKAQMDFIPPNTTAIQPRKRNKGTSSGNLYNPQAFAEGLVTMRDSFFNHGDDMIDVIYAPVIKAAQARAHVARVQAETGTRKATQHSSIYDRYLQNLTGRSSLSANDSFFGDAYEWLEQRMNGFLASPTVALIGGAARKGGAHAAATLQMFNDFIRSSKPGQSIQGERFDKFSRELGKYMPFKSVTEMVEKQAGFKTPIEVAEISSKLSWFEAAMRLRWFESMHAVVNLTSMVSNMPAIIRNFQPKAGETAADVAQRTGMVTMSLSVPGKGTVEIPNMMKLIHDSYKDAWQKVPDEFTKRALRLGYMDQEVAEFQRQWGVIDSKAGWRGFMFGDEAAEGTGVGAKLKRSGGIDHWLGVLSDKSEAFSRQWGMYAGRRLAVSLGIDDVAAQVNFAHELTNRIIANYDPRNRAEVFQGALGAPIGLFQSYVINYYQRLFRYIETKDTAALATQYATQAALFGTASVPGWNALNWAFFDHGQNKGDDPVDSIYQRFGKADGDLLMHGTLSNLPKILNIIPGVDGVDGVSLYTRGDSQFRMPVIPTPELLGGSGTSSLPVLDTLTRIWNGIGQGADMFTQSKDNIGVNQLAEIVSNVLTNRPLAGIIESIGAKGYDTAWDGQVASESRSAMDHVYRALGIRSMAQQKELEMFYANKSAMEGDAARQDVLRRAARSAVRREDFDAIPRLFQEYVENGGNPRYYSRYVKEVFSSGLDSRGERMLDKALKDGSNKSNAIIARMLDAGVDTGEDEAAVDDYGREQQVEEVVNRGWETSPDPGEEVLGY